MDQVMSAQLGMNMLRPSVHVAPMLFGTSLGTSWTATTTRAIQTGAFSRAQTMSQVFVPFPGSARRTISWGFSAARSPG